MRGRIFVIAALIAFAGCSTMAETNGKPLPADSRLDPCPSSPNCVSSADVPPFELGAPAEEAWATLKKVLEARPRTEIVESGEHYLRAEETSRLFGFVDDVEFKLKPERNSIIFRSASRVGYWDLGVNKRRIEAIREALEGAGVIKSD